MVKILFCYARRKSLFLAILVISFIFVISCDKNPEVSEISGFALGTTYSIKIVAVKEKVDFDQIKTRIVNLLAAHESSFSVYEANSEISRFNTNSTTSWQHFSPEMISVLVESDRIAKQTQGAFDYTIGNLIEVWGFGKQQRKAVIPEKQEIIQGIETSGFGKISLNVSESSAKKTDEKLTLNLSAIAKGYAVDQVAGLLEENGISNYLVEIGGEIKTSGTKPQGKPWVVAIERPVPTERSIQRVMHLESNAMATSGDYRNYFEIKGKRFSHTINPKTGWPVNNKIASVSVITPSCMRSDAMATALMVMGFEKGFAFAKQHGYAVFWILKEDGEFVEKHSPAFQPFLLEE